MITNKSNETMSMYSIIESAVTEWATKRGLHVSFEERYTLGVTVICEESKGLWLDSQGGTCDGTVGNFEVGYQHCDSQLKSIRATMMETKALLFIYTKNAMDDRAKLLDATLNMFE